MGWGSPCHVPNSTNSTSRQTLPHSSQPSVPGDPFRSRSVVIIDGQGVCLYAPFMLSIGLAYRAFADYLFGAALLLR